MLLLKAVCSFHEVPGQMPIGRTWEIKISVSCVVDVVGQTMVFSRWGWGYQMCDSCQRWKMDSCVITALPPILGKILRGKKIGVGRNSVFGSCVYKVCVCFCLCVLVCIFKTLLASWLFSFLFLFVFTVALVVYGSYLGQESNWSYIGSQCHSHGNPRSELHLRSMLHLVAMPDP